MEVPLLEVLDQKTLTSNPLETTKGTQELCPAITTVYKTNKKYSFGSVEYKPKKWVGANIFPFLVFV